MPVTKKNGWAQGKTTNLFLKLLSSNSEKQEQSELRGCTHK